MEDQPNLRTKPVAFFAHHWRWVLGVVAAAFVIVALASTLSSGTAAKTQGVSNQSCQQAASSLATFLSAATPSWITKSSAAAVQYRLLMTDLTDHCSAAQVAKVNATMIQPWLTQKK